jgi:surface antigen
MRTAHVAMIAALALGATACTTPPSSDVGPKQATGAAVGAAGGGGKNAVAIGAGAALGGIGGLLMGSAAGQSMDRADRMYAQQSWNQAMRSPVGEPIVWENQATGNSGQTVATRQGTLASSGTTCREYTTKIKVGSKSETLVGTACQNGDGTWSERG